MFSGFATIDFKYNRINATTETGEITLNHFDPANFEYRAFISYSREDAEFVDDLHNRIVKYRTPRSLLRQEGEYGHPPRILRVFLDRKSAEAGGSLSDRIVRQLENTAFLIVVCTENSKNRPWVNDEISTFAKVAGVSRILPVYVRRSAETTLQDITPPALDCLDSLPLGADLLNDGGIQVVRDKLIGGLLGFSQDKITMEQEISDRRRRLIDRSAILVIATFLVAAVWLGKVALRERDEALEVQSRFYASLSRVVAGEPPSVFAASPSDAALLAVQALPTRSAGRPRFLDRPYVPQAENALYFALSQLHVETVLEGHIDAAYDVHFVPNSNMLLTSGGDGTARSWNAESGEAIETFRHNETCKAISGTEPVACSISSSAVSHRGELALTATSEGTTKLWNLNSGAELGSWKNHDSRVWSTGFSYDDRLFLTASDDGFCEVREVSTGRLLARFNHTDRIFDARFDSSGERVVTAGSDGKARIWKISDGALVATFEGHDSSIFEARFLGVSESVLTISRDGSAKAWDPSSGLEEWSFSIEGHNVMSVNFSGEKIRVASEGALWDGMDRRKIADLSGHRHLYGAHFSPDGNLLLTVDEGSGEAPGGVGRIWDVDTGRLVSELKGHEDAIRGATWRPDSEGIATASLDGSVRTWRRRSPLQVFDVSDEPQDIHSAAFSYDSMLLAIHAHDTVTLRDASDGLSVSYAEFRSNWALTPGLVFSPDDRYLVVYRGNRAMIWRLENNQLADPVAIGCDLRAQRSENQPFLPPTDCEVQAVAFDADSSRLALAFSDGRIPIWNLSQGHTERIFSHSECSDESGRMCEVGVTFGSQRVIGWFHGRDGGHLRLWDVDSGNQEHDISFVNLDVMNALVSPNGKLLAIALRDHVAELRDLKTAKLRETLKGHELPIQGLAFSSDSSVLATTSWDGTARLWDTSTGSEIHVLYGHTSRIDHVAISPNQGRLRVLTGSMDGTARLWDSETGNVLSVFNHQDEILTASFSADGSRILTVSESAAKLWRVVDDINELVRLSYAHLPCQRQSLQSHARKRYLLEDKTPVNSPKANVLQTLLNQIFSASIDPTRSQEIQQRCR